jgi:spore germination protein GerM
MKITGAVIIILAVAALSWALFSTSHPFLSFPVESNATGTVPKTGTLTVNLYFPNATLDPSICPKTFAVERNIADTPTIVRDTLAALLAGPTDTEKKSGYATMLTSGAGIQSLRIEDGLASIDLDRAPLKEPAGSCHARTARAQMEATLKQFPSVNAVMISANGQAQM